jgi:mRNA interferase RelE/StbE
VYEVYLERSAEKDLRRLAAEDFHRVISRIKDLKKNPRPPRCHKIAGSKRDWRIRVGNYRILYEIDVKTKVVKVMRVKHRREVYR